MIENSSGAFGTRKLMFLHCLLKGTHQTTIKRGSLTHEDFSPQCAIPLVPWSAVHNSKAVGGLGQHRTWIVLLQVFPDCLRELGGQGTGVI